LYSRLTKGSKHFFKLGHGDAANTANTSRLGSKPQVCPTIKHVTRPTEPNLAIDLAPKEIIERNPGRGGSFYVKNNGLLYLIDELGRYRLCVPSSQEKLVFKTAHNNRHHGKFFRTYQFILVSCCVHRLVKRLKLYIKHCETCSLNRSHTHQPYGELQPIITPSVLFYTLTIDFIVALPPTSIGTDLILTITYKFTKAVKLVPGKTT